MGGLGNTSAWDPNGVLAWAMFAVVAGGGLAAAAATLWRRLARIGRDLDFDAGYNALAPYLD